MPTKLQAENDASTIAKNDAGSGKYFEVENLIRDNGWQEEQEYKIKFNYDLVAKSSYPEIFIEKLKVFTDEGRSMTAEERKKMMLPMAMVGMAFGLQGMMGGSTPVEKAINLVKKNANIQDYINANQDYYDKNPGALNFLLGVVYSELEDLGLDENMVKGQKLSRTITIGYKKTEKGWIKKE